MVLNDLFMRLLSALQARRQSGQGLVEYALILVLVSITAVAFLTPMATAINAVYTAVTAALAV